jgi:hypothetical protein
MFKNVRPLFLLGRTVMTAGVLETLRENGINPLSLLARHIQGDWATWTSTTSRPTRKRSWVRAPPASLVLPGRRAVGRSPMINRRSNPLRSSLLAGSG